MHVFVGRMLSLAMSSFNSTTVSNTLVCAQLFRLYKHFRCAPTHQKRKCELAPAHFFSLVSSDIPQASIPSILNFALFLVPLDNVYKECPPNKYSGPSWRDILLHSSNSRTRTQTHIHFYEMDFEGR